MFPGHTSGRRDSVPSNFSGIKADIGSLLHTQVQLPQHALRRHLLLPLPAWLHMLMTNSVVSHSPAVLGARVTVIEAEAPLLHEADSTVVRLLQQAAYLDR